jgi:hypothetical protein
VSSSTSLTFVTYIYPHSHWTYAQHVQLDRDSDLALNP